MIRRPPRSTLFPLHDALPISASVPVDVFDGRDVGLSEEAGLAREYGLALFDVSVVERDRKSTRLNSSHSSISYAVFCLKKKKKRKKTKNQKKNDQTIH